MIDLMTAIQSLRPNAELVIRGDVIEWLDTVQAQPTDSEIQAEVTKLQAVYDSQEYARKRRADYPTIEECVHAILDDDLDALQSKRAEVKLRYPK